MIVMPSLTHGRWAGMIVDMVAKAGDLVSFGEVVKGVDATRLNDWASVSVVSE